MAEVFKAKKLSAPLPASLHRLLKRRAIDDEITVQDFVIKAIETALSVQPTSEEPWLSGVREILASKNELAIGNITTAISASRSLLQLRRRNPRDGEVIPLSAPVTASTGNKSQRREKKVG